jgi:hypothetical protein
MPSSGPQINYFITFQLSAIKCMLIHRQNSYVLPSQRRTGRREEQGRGTGQQSKNLLSVRLF